MAATVVAVVTAVREREEEDDNQLVDSLAWLTHDESQAADLIRQTNTVIRRRLLRDKPEMAGKAAGMVAGGRGRSASLAGQGTSCPADKFGSS